MLLALFNIFACFVLGDSFYRVYKATKDNKDLQINSRMMLAHIVSYALFALALFFFFLGNISPTWTKQTNSRIFDTLTLISTGSQLILIAIFNIICKQQELARNSEVLMSEF